MSKLSYTYPDNDTHRRPELCRSGRISLEEAARRISEMTAFTQADVVGVVYALSGLVTDETAQGNIIDLTPLGRFIPTLRTDKSNSAKCSKKNEPPLLSVAFTPSNKMLRQLACTSLTRRMVVAKNSVLSL